MITTKQQMENDKASILYRKVGKKYVPVSDPWAYNGLREGWWLVGVQPGSVTMRQCVYPDKAALQAAAHELQDQLINIIRKASEAKINKVPLTEQLKKDWEWLISKHGEELSTLCYPSFAQNAEDIVNVILNKANETSNYKRYTR